MVSDIPRKKYEDLPFPARMNIDCGEMAGSFLRDPNFRLEPRPSALVMSKITLLINGKAVTSNIPGQIRSKLHGERIKEYINRNSFLKAMLYRSCKC